MALTRFGFHFSSTTYEGWSSESLFATILEVAEAAEESGFDSLWVPDHVHQNNMGGGPETPMLEAYTLLAALAARTTTARLGALVSPVTFRAPALLAKTIASLDVVSGGRAVLGIGAAWDTDEHAAYGIEFPPLGERFERLEETLEICAAMLGRGPTTISRGHYALDHAWNSPPPIQSHVPVLVGGGGERRTLALVARFGDACNFFGEAADITRKLEVLRGHCERIGRDYAEITTTVGVMPPGDADELCRVVEDRFSLGVDGVVLFGGSCPSARQLREWGAALTKAFS